MDGRAVFKMATTNMIAVAQEVLARNEVHMEDVSLVLMHQANKRINEYCQKALGHPGREGPAQHRALREHHRRHHPPPLGRSGARAAASSPATSSCWSPSAPG